MEPDRRPLPFLGGPAGADFAKRELTVAPGCSQAYDPADWRDAIVVLERGRVDLVHLDGRRVSLSDGAVVSLDGLALRCLHNPGPAPAVLVAVSRRRPSAGP